MNQPATALSIVVTAIACMLALSGLWLRLRQPEHDETYLASRRANPLPPSYSDE